MPNNGINFTKSQRLYDVPIKISDLSEPSEL